MKSGEIINYEKYADSLVAKKKISYMNVRIDCNGKKKEKKLVQSW